MRNEPYRNWSGNVYSLCRAQIDPGHVTANNYRMFWHITLWLEEVAQMLMLKRYNMENVMLRECIGGRLLPFRFCFRSR